MPLQAKNNLSTEDTCSQLGHPLDNSRTINLKPTVGGFESSLPLNYMGMEQ